MKSLRAKLIGGCWLALWLTSRSLAASDLKTCLECHLKLHPQLIDEWLHSRHGQTEVGCPECHGRTHLDSHDVSRAQLPTPATCATCHDTQARQFRRSRHAQAWDSLKALPVLHFQTGSLPSATPGCKTCHRIGSANSADLRGLDRSGSSVGLTSCSACHPGHRFAKSDARPASACTVCHVAAEHPANRPSSGGTPGVRTLLQQGGFIASGQPPPTCQQCHMPNADHGVQTAWGLAEISRQFAADPQTAADRAVILRALSLPAAPARAPADPTTAQQAQEPCQRQRARMLSMCGQCHPTNYARLQLEAGDHAVRQADHTMALAIRVVADLYRDGILQSPEGNATNLPALPTLGRSAIPIEQKLFAMYLGYRMQPVRGSFHVQSDDALWIGWSELDRDLAAIKSLAFELREQRQSRARRRPTNPAGALPPESPFPAPPTGLR